MIALVIPDSQYGVILAHNALCLPNQLCNIPGYDKNKVLIKK